MSYATDDGWVQRGWVGAPEVILPFKVAVEALIVTSDVGIVSPPAGDPPGVVDDAGALVGFAVDMRPGVVVDVPAGAFGMSRSVAAALLSALG